MEWKEWTHRRSSVLVLLRAFVTRQVHAIDSIVGLLRLITTTDTSSELLAMIPAYFTKRQILLHFQIHHSVVAPPRGKSQEWRRMHKYKPSRIQPKPFNTLLHTPAASWRSRQLQTTNRKWYMAHRIQAIPITLSSLQGHLTSCKPLQMLFFLQLCII